MCRLELSTEHIHQQRQDLMSKNVVCCLLLSVQCILPSANWAGAYHTYANGDHQLNQHGNSM